MPSPWTADPKQAYRRGAQVNNKSWSPVPPDLTDDEEDEEGISPEAPSGTPPPQPATPPPLFRLRKFDNESFAPQQGQLFRQFKETGVPPTSRDIQRAQLSDLGHFLTTPLVSSPRAKASDNPFAYLGNSLLEGLSSPAGFAAAIPGGAVAGKALRAGAKLWPRATTGLLAGGVAGTTGYALHQYADKPHSVQAQAQLLEAGMGPMMAGFFGGGMLFGRMGKYLARNASSKIGKKAKDLARRVALHGTQAISTMERGATHFLVDRRNLANPDVEAKIAPFLAGIPMHLTALGTRARFVAAGAYNPVRNQFRALRGYAPGGETPALSLRDAMASTSEMVLGHRVRLREGPDAEKPWTVAFHDYVQKAANPEYRVGNFMTSALFRTVQDAALTSIYGHMRRMGEGGDLFMAGMNRYRNIAETMTGRANLAFDNIVDGIADTASKNGETVTTAWARIMDASRRRLSLYDEALETDDDYLKSLGEYQDVLAEKVIDPLMASGRQYGFDGEFWGPYDVMDNSLNNPVFIAFVKKRIGGSSAEAVKALKADTSNKFWNEFRTKHSDVEWRSDLNAFRHQLYAYSKNVARLWVFGDYRPSQPRPDPFTGRTKVLGLGEVPNDYKGVDGTVDADKLPPIYQMMMKTSDPENFDRYARRIFNEDLRHLGSLGSPYSDSPTRMGVIATLGAYRLFSLPQVAMDFAQLGSARTAVEALRYIFSPTARQRNKDLLKRIGGDEATRQHLAQAQMTRGRPVDHTDTRAHAEWHQRDPVDKLYGITSTAIRERAMFIQAYYRQISDQYEKFALGYRKAQETGKETGEYKRLRSLFIRGLGLGDHTGYKSMNDAADALAERGLKQLEANPQARIQADMDTAEQLLAYTIRTRYGTTNPEALPFNMSTDGSLLEMAYFLQKTVFALKHGLQEYVSQNGMAKLPKAMSYAAGVTAVAESLQDATFEPAYQALGEMIAKHGAGVTQELIDEFNEAREKRELTEAENQTWFNRFLENAAASDFAGHASQALYWIDGPGTDDLMRNVTPMIRIAMEGTQRGIETLDPRQAAATWGQFVLPAPVGQAVHHAAKLARHRDLAQEEPEEANDGSSFRESFKRTHPRQSRELPQRHPRLTPR